MITVLRNPAGEIAIVNSMAGFTRLAPYDVIASRFEGAVVVYRLPLVAEHVGWTAAVRMLIASLGAVYPDPASLRLGIVDATGRVLHRGSTKTLGIATGSTGRTIMSRLMVQRAFSQLGGWVVHL